MVASSIYNLLMIHKLLITSLLASTMAFASCTISEAKPNPASLEIQRQLLDKELSKTSVHFKNLGLSKEQFSSFCLDYFAWRDEQPGKWVEWTEHYTKWKTILGKVSPEAKQAWGDSWLKKNPDVKKISTKQLFDAFEKTFPALANQLQKTPPPKVSSRTY